MTAHRLTAEDVTAIVEEKNKLVRENYQLRLMVENMKLAIEQYKKALRFNDPPDSPVALTEEQLDEWGAKHALSRADARPVSGCGTGI